MDFHDDLLRTIEDGEIAESEEVHLEKSECFEWTCRELCDYRSGVFRRWLERTEVDHRLWCDDDSTGMDSELADRPFHLESSIDDFFVLFITFIGIFELGRLHKCF